MDMILCGSYVVACAINTKGNRRCLFLFVPLSCHVSRSSEFAKELRCCNWLSKDPICSEQPGRPEASPAPSCQCHQWLSEKARVASKVPMHMMQPSRRAQWHVDEPTKILQSRLDTSFEIGVGSSPHFHPKVNMGAWKTKTTKIETSLTTLTLPNVTFGSTTFPLSTKGQQFTGVQYWDSADFWQWLAIVPNHGIGRLA